MERIRAKSIRQTEYLIALWEVWLAPLGVTLNSPRDASRRGSHVSLGHPEGLRINRALIEQMRVIPDFRYPDNIRLGIAPLYTSFAEIYEGMVRLRQVIEARSYEQYPLERPDVTWIAIDRGRVQILLAKIVSATREAKNGNIMNQKLPYVRTCSMDVAGRRGAAGLGAGLGADRARAAVVPDDLPGAWPAAGRGRVRAYPHGCAQPGARNGRDREPEPGAVPRRGQYPGRRAAQRLAGAHAPAWAGRRC